MPTSAPLGIFMVEKTSVSTIILLAKKSYAKGVQEKKVFCVLFPPLLKNENLTWGAKRISGELLKLNIDLDTKTIRNILSEYISYYNDLRPHQGIDQQIPKGYLAQEKGVIRSKPILGGLHHHYFKEVA